MENNSALANSSNQHWEMPFGCIIFTIVYLALNIVISLFINTLLIVIMNYSPSLRTPPNTHLMNICANNLLMCTGMLFSLLCINFNTLQVEMAKSRALSGVQLFLVFNSMLQYWGTFAAIGYYRHKTIKRPTLSLGRRRHVVSRCITGNWIVSLLLSTTCSLSFTQSSPYLRDSIDPFRKEYYLGRRQDTPPEQLIIIFVFLTVFIMGLVVIISSYYSICKMLNITGRFAKNRIIPWQRSPSIPSDATDVPIQARQSYRSDGNNAGAYSISANIKGDNFIVHYQKCDHSLAFEDIIALENPILAVRIRQHYNQKRTLKPTLSTGSTASTRSKCVDFSDITTGAGLERYQMLKNNSILRNQSLKRDRVSLSSATKNSLVMLSAYVVCSMPLIICTIPGALNLLQSNHRIIALLFCRLIFCINAPIYPLWYLLFSKRIRTCLNRLCESMLIRLNMRR
ncbi:hypothetical protein SNE40_002519 [Patella caerulea]|uniref:G-protein coupled receptors family 1 profile domain-containing protein n=2 Tax=Patella caerulea TaxID=87958 RepID=A0AAN8K668_PATCE